jgi:heparan-alpha-glucosaminide N-acetyltransferase
MNNNQNFRISSIDILRALTMLLMIFVNDLWSLKNIPGWLEHTSANEDGMGLADTVFPAFLFLVGMSIPLSVQHRRQKGDTNNKILLHIIERSFALLVMGVFLVNGEEINEVASGIHRFPWNLICCTVFIILWNSWPKRMNKFLLGGLKILAIISLLILAFIYRSGGNGEDIHRFAPHWWGILGLIGWAYFISAVIYTFSANKFYILFIAWLLFLFLCIASHAGWIPHHSIIAKIISPFGGGSMPAFTMGGVLITLLLLDFRQRNETAKMMITFFGIAVVLFLCGLYLRTFWGISKIRATPAWVLICSAITIVVFMLIYWLTDKKGKANWFNIILPAGTNTLLCYLLPYYAYDIPMMFHLYLPAFVLTGIIGLFKSFIFALLIVIATGWLGKMGMRLKL